MLDGPVPLIPTMIVIFILSIVGTVLMFWALSDYKEFNTRVAIGVGVAIGLILAAAFLMWIFPRLILLS